MNRRSFLKFLGMGAAVAAAPSLAFEVSSTPVWIGVDLASTKGAALVAISRELMVESPSVEALVRADLVTQLENATDEQLMNALQNCRSNQICLAAYVTADWESSNEKTIILEGLRNRIAIADEIICKFARRSAAADSTARVVVARSVSESISISRGLDSRARARLGGVTSHAT